MANTATPSIAKSILVTPTEALNYLPASTSAIEVTYDSLGGTNSDTACHSLMGKDLKETPGGPTHSLKNQGDVLNANCASEWTGTWVVCDNDHCDWSRQTFQFPIVESDEADFSPPLGARSVKYINSGHFFDFSEGGPSS